MSNGVAIRKKPVTVRAERYGDRETGEFTEESVYRLAQFILGRPEVSHGELASVLAPAAGKAFDPDDGAADLEVYDGVVHHAWLPLRLGQWVIIGLKGEPYPCDHEVIMDSYDFVEAQ